jgi:hypothetical protein
VDALRPAVNPDPVQTNNFTSTMKRKPLPRWNTVPLAHAIVPVLALSLLTLAWAAPAQRQPPRRNIPEIPEVARGEAICFAYYTVHRVSSK